MGSTGFATLALLVAVGLAGPVLSAVPRLGAPLVIGEIAAGLVIGRSGFDLVAVDDPPLTLLSDIGFALLMLIVGTHLPLRRPGLRPALRRAAVAAALTAVLAAGGGLLLARWTGLHHPDVLAVLIATSSAAVALPVISTLEDRPALLVVTTWVALLDVGTVLAVPLVVRQGSLRAVLAGIVGVAVLAAVVFGLATRLRHHVWSVRLRDRSRERHWALDLRVSLVVLFGLAALATRQHTSVLVPGFAAGAVLALLGEPRRLAEQLIGLGEGFLVPIFFVTLGARLRLTALGEPRNLVLAASLAATATLVHVAVAAAVRLPLGAGLLATAQLGVPAAVASIGLTTGLLGAGQAAAVLAAAVVSLGACSAGAALLGHRDGTGDHTAAGRPVPAG